MEVVTVFAARVDGRGPGVRAQQQLLCCSKKPAGDQRQVFGGLAGEEFGEVDAVVRGRGSSHSTVTSRSCRAGVSQAFQELVADHAVPDDDDFHDAFLVRSSSYANSVGQRAVVQGLLLALCSALKRTAMAHSAAIVAATPR